MINEAGFSDWLKLSVGSELTIKEYQRYLKHFGDRYNLHQEYANQWLTTNNNNVARAFIKKFIQYVLQEENNEELITQIKNITIPILKRKNKEIIRPIINKEDILKMGENPERERDYLMLMISFFCGLRRAGLLSLKYPDLVRPLMAWQTRGDNKKGLSLTIIITEKGNKEREIFIPNPIALRLLKYLIKVEKNLDIKQGKKNIWGIKKTRWGIILNQMGHRILGKGVKTHTLRRSFATHLLNNGFRIEEVSEMLGHKNIATTQLYARPDLTRLKQKHQEVMGFENLN